jgi:hypothetical protein
MKAVLAGMLAFTLLLTACAPRPAEPGPAAGDEERARAIQAAIIEANHCREDSDCSLVGSYCPFGCHIYVHKDEAARIRELVEGYQSTCIYSCIYSPGPACRDGTCTFIEGLPPAE